MDADHLTPAETELVTAAIAVMKLLGIEGEPTLEEFKAALRVLAALQHGRRLH